jgi:transposase InsO family protein
MHLHSNATTTFAIRRQIQQASGSISSIARRFGVSWPTAKRWRTRTGVEDHSCRPGSFRTAIDAQLEEDLLRERRRLLSLDEIYDHKLDEYPKLSRSSVWRLFRRHGLGRLKRYERKPHAVFKPYAPGYLHIDSFYTPRFGSTRYYGFIAIDRATRRTHVAVYDNRRASSGADFLRQCTEVFEFKIQKVLTDNGTEFSNKTYNRSGKAKAIHAFDKVCAEHKIQHRNTKPRTPKTNGMAERQVSIVKNATVRAHTYINPEAMACDLQDWNRRNNSRRQRRIKYRTPLQVSQSWYDLKPELFHREPIPKDATQLIS